MDAEIQQAQWINGRRVVFCSRLDCHKAVGLMPYTIHGSLAVYCSQECVDAVIEQTTGRKHRVKVANPDFPGTGIVKHVCDNCGKRLTLTWRGRDGEYCSKNCMDAKEKSVDQATETEEQTPAPTEPKENTNVSNGTTTAKAKKTAKKGKATAAKGKAKVAKTASNHDGTIKTLVKDNPCRPDTFCFAQVEACMKSKRLSEAQKRLDASKLNPNKRRLETAWLEKQKYIKVTYDSK